MPKQRARATLPKATELNAKLDAIHSDLTAVLLEHTDDAAAVAAIDERLGRAQPEPEVALPSLLELYDSFNAHKASRTRASTMQVYAALRSHLAAFLAARQGGTLSPAEAVVLTRFGGHFMGLRVPVWQSSALRV